MQTGKVVLCNVSTQNVDSPRKITRNRRIRLFPVTLGVNVEKCTQSRGEMQALAERMGALNLSTVNPRAQIH